ncbi:glucose-6-phosphate exchanger SLC37A4-like isoform X1 [Homarus americanus]|uniref:glucose-6-phosphate exchanger SLC37A4-like isoform X1 n=1 Tax=Homarus americanus TaxID=6706 RepID=UPI001C44E7CC|nr:glucose-6-phosphate exchanger SLC37A4-like isoform X1 [Homarus americanus]
MSELGREKSGPCDCVAPSEYYDWEESFLSDPDNEGQLDNTEVKAGMESRSKMEMNGKPHMNGKVEMNDKSHMNGSVVAGKQETLQSYQRAVFGALFLGYACYIFNRKSVSYAIPTLLASGLITTNTIGIISSCQNTAYAISKFLGGVLSDRMSARVLFSMGLAMSGASTLLFSRTENSVLWALLWFLNGFAQGAGWPACAKLLKKWFNPANFGTWWSVLTASGNVSGTISPLLAAYVIINHGWSASLIIAGLLSLVMAGLTLVTLVDDPAHVHLPDPTALPAHHAASTNKSVVGESMTVGQLASSPFLWLVSACYLVVFCTKTALSDWGQIYLIEELGRTQMQASSFTSAMETGGFFGGILAGILTDKISNKVNLRGNGRLMVAASFMVACTVGVHSLRTFLTPSTSQVVVSGVGMLLGASMFGPISIYGIVASESFPAHLSGTAHAVVALAANVGAVVAGWPLSWVARTWSWGGVLLLLEILVASSVALILSTTRLHIKPKPKIA